MKTIDVKDQPGLSLARTFEICISGVKYRLFRSVVTVVVIAVATAFVMNVLCEAISVRSVAEATKSRVEEQRLVAQWTSRLSTAGTVESILRESAAIPAGSPRLTEAGQLGGLAPADLTQFHQGARAAEQYLAFFEGMDYGRRRRMAGPATGVEIFDRLQDPGALQRFNGALKEMRSLRLPTKPEQFLAFLRDWPGLRAKAQKVQAGRGAAVARVAQALGGKPMADALTGADGPFGEQVRAAGFSAFDDTTRKLVTTRARQLREMELLDDGIANPALRKRVSAVLDIQPSELSSGRLWEMLNSAERAAWYLQELKAAKLDADSLTAQRIVELAKAKRDEAAVENAGRLTGQVQGGFLGIGGRMAWLVLVSLLVCGVGIANAMLMTVTERFREIATLKCLGALDGFIMLLFLMEASLFGVVGGLFGGLLGSVIGFGRMLSAFGSVLTWAFPFGPWMATLGMSVAVGVILAALSGVYPSYYAARLAPMEAMRIE